MPRGPGKKENYNLDYSRFNSFDRDEDDDAQKKKDADAASKAQRVQDEADAAGGHSNMPDMRDLLRSMPVELQEAYHLMSIAKANGDEKAQKMANELALKAVEKGGPEVRNAFMKNVAEQMPEIAGKVNTNISEVAPSALDPKKIAPEQSEDRIENLRKQMEEGQKATRAEMDKLQKKQEELERIRNPEDFFKFMQEEGINQEDLQRMFSGDEDHMKKRFSETMERKEKEEKAKSQEASEALKKVDELHSTLFGSKPEEPPAQDPEPEKPVRRAPEPPKEPEVTIPMYRLQYEKDAAGKYVSVELKCTLPGVADMSSINLDISERHLRLSTTAPAPRYAVNAGPFPVLIDASGARAKYSKKREELSISVPAKLD